MTVRRRRRWARRALVAGAMIAMLGSAAMYVGYRVMFRKNPEVVRQIRAAEQRQADIEAAFATPADGS